LTERTPVGRHRLFQDGPILLFEHQGDFEFLDATQATAVYAEIIQQYGYLLLILDFTHGGDLDPKSRRLLVDWGKQNVHRLCIAAFGGNIVFRTTFRLVINAIRILSSQALTAQFCSDFAEALAWLKSCEARYTAA
jgi:hypothetical protein